MNCEYGCGKKAKHRLKNGKWCCEITTKKCPEIIRKSSVSRTAQKRNKEQIKNISLGHIGIPSVKKGISYEKYYGERCNEIKRKLRNSKLIIKDINKIKQKYPFLYKVEVFKINKVTKDIMVKCKNSSCEKWFTPTYSQIYERYRALTSPAGFEENNFYCSEKCKNTCILYGSTVEELEQSGENRVFVNYVLKRDNYICQYCGEKADHVHHERPQKLEPFFVLDPDFAWSVCKNCHYKYGHKKGTECSTGSLSRVICFNKEIKSWV